MNKLTFNTGQPVTKEGQVITIQEHTDGTVLFHDHSSKVAGRITPTYHRAEGSTLREFVMKHYRKGNYMPSAAAEKLVRSTIAFSEHEFVPEDERSPKADLVGEQFEHDGRPIRFSDEPFVDGPVHYIVNYHVVGKPSIQYTDLVVDCQSPVHAMATVIRDKARQGARIQVIFIEPTYRRNMLGYNPVNDHMRAGAGWAVDAEHELSPATFQPHR